MSKSALERQFDVAWRCYGTGQQPVTEYMFAAAIGRRFRFDYAFLPQLVAVEIDGGQWAQHGGRHNTDADREKLNLAAALGWRVLRFSGAMLKDPEAVCKMARLALEQLQPCGHPCSAIRGDGVTHWCEMCEGNS